LVINIYEYLASGLEHLILVKFVPYSANGTGKACRWPRDGKIDKKKNEKF
jgi:hypothetical protein